MTTHRPLILWALLIAGLGASVYSSRPVLQAQTQAPKGQPARAQAEAPQAAPEAATMADMPGMTGDEASTHPWCADTVWSEFNHRVAGWFLLFWGLTALIAGLQWPRLTWWRYVPPMVLFGLAEFLFFRNDPETWPTGPLSFWASLHDPEDLQHRIFLLLVILIALVELLRASGRLSKFMGKYALPALGCFGAIYLFFHKHGGAGMASLMAQAQQPGGGSNPAVKQMLAVMKLVKHEHLWFSLFGFGLVAAKLVADTGHLKGRWGATLWSVFAVMLGVYMIGYVE